nr:hypothetical protein [Tanacetum cinerariifolium]
MTEKYFVKYIGIEVKHFRDTLLQNMGNVKKFVFERARHQRQYDRRVNKKLMQTQESKIDMGKAVNDDLVVTESSGTESEVQDDNSRSGNDTDADDADIKSIYDKEPMAKTIEQTTSLLANNADLKAQIQEKVFPISALKNDLRKLKGNNEAKKKTQERDRNSKSSVMTPARFQSTTADSKPKPRSTNHSSRSLYMSKSSCVTMTAMPKADHSKSPSSFSDHTRFFCSTCNKCVFNANHDACITKLLKEVNLRAKIQSHKTKNRNKPVDQKSHTQIPGRQIFTGHKFSPNKTSAVYEKISPRSDLSWQPTGGIFKSVGLRWLPTGKLFDSCTNKVESEPPHGSNVDISKIHECKQTLDLSACTSINVSKKQNLYGSACILRMSTRKLSDSDPAPECQTMGSDQLSFDPAPECQTMALNHDSLSPVTQRQENVPQADKTGSTSNELDLLFSPMFDELLNGSSKVVSQSYDVSAADAPNQRQQHTTPLNIHTTLAS